MDEETPSRRQHKRTSTELVASVEQIDNTLSASVLNISQGGLFIRCPNPPAQWQNIDIAIKLPDGSVVKARGVVVWRLTSDHSDPRTDVFPGAGIQFLEIADDDLKSIAEAVGQPV